MDFKKLNEAIENAVKGCNDAETVKALNDAKIELGAVQQEAERIEQERNELSDANGKLLETLKKQILQTGNSETPPKENPSEARSFETILAEKAKQYAETQKGK